MNREAGVNVGCCAAFTGHASEGSLAGSFPCAMSAPAPVSHHG